MRGRPAGAEANLAKLLAADASWEAANVCLQTFGGFGFAADYDVERKFRETRLYQVAPISTNLILSYIGEHVLGTAEVVLMNSQRPIPNSQGSGAGRFMRSMLFVPGSRPAMFPKAAASEADAVCLDLEDSVLPDEKAAARANIVRALHEIDFGQRVRMVRINSLDTDYADRDLMEVMEGAGDRVDVIMIPKAASAADVEFVDAC